MSKCKLCCFTVNTTHACIIANNYIVSNLNNIRYHVKSLNNMDQAQVTAGGVNLDEIDPNTMESKYVDGLYIVGELLDIDGICGGYNLTFAILSGIKAGKSIYDKKGEYAIETNVFIFKAIFEVCGFGGGLHGAGCPGGNRSAWQLSAASGRSRSGRLRG
jgi:hypothetical protein